MSNGGANGHASTADGSPPWLSGPPRVGQKQPDALVEVPPPPGQGPITSAGLAIGILLLAVQLWLLTIALELFLSGHGSIVWSLALVSGLIFAGGLLVLWVLRRRPRVATPWPADMQSVRETTGAAPPGRTR